MWNGRDPILKERLFGLTGNEGNHGEDVKEYYFYLDSTPTHSYMKYLYKYPQAAFPYAQLVEENRRRAAQRARIRTARHRRVRGEPLLRRVRRICQGLAGRHLCIRITVVNRGPEPAELTCCRRSGFATHGPGGRTSGARVSRKAESTGQISVIETRHDYYGLRWLLLRRRARAALHRKRNQLRSVSMAIENASAYVKDGNQRLCRAGRKRGGEPGEAGTKARLTTVLTLAPGETTTVKLRLTDTTSRAPGFGRRTSTRCLTTRIARGGRILRRSSPERSIGRMRAACSARPLPACSGASSSITTMSSAGSKAIRRSRRLRVNACMAATDWTHLYNADVISMPDKWEYPWYAAWDLAFHCIPLALVDPDFAKEQLILMLREWYMHPNGQLPAYEWAFGDVNPPVHAWAAWRVYKIEKKRRGVGRSRVSGARLPQAAAEFHLVGESQGCRGRNVFQGGFLGLDNIGVFDRSAPLPTGGHIEQSDGTSWMGMYCLNMLAIALELAQDRSGLRRRGQQVLRALRLHRRRHEQHRRRRRSSCGTRRTASTTTCCTLPNGGTHPHEGALDGRADSAVRRGDAGLRTRRQAAAASSAACSGSSRTGPTWRSIVEHADHRGRGVRRLLSLVNRDRLNRVLRYMLDEKEFLSPYGIRALSRYHHDHPYVSRRWARASRGLRTGGIQHGHVRRQFQLARTGLVSGQLSADRVAAEVPLLSRRPISRWSARPARASQSTSGKSRPRSHAA